MYLALKFMHLLGVVLLIGNVAASAVSKVFANRTDDAVVVVVVVVVAFAQRLVSFTDGSHTLGGVVLMTVGGYGMAVVADLADGDEVLDRRDSDRRPVTRAESTPIHLANRSACRCRF